MELQSSFCRQNWYCRWMCWHTSVHRHQSPVCNPSSQKASCDSCVQWHTV